MASLRNLSTNKRIINTLIITVIVAIKRITMEVKEEDEEVKVLVIIIRIIIIEEVIINLTRELVILLIILGILKLEGKIKNRIMRETKNGEEVILEESFIRSHL